MAHFLTVAQSQISSFLEIDTNDNQALQSVLGAFLLQFTTGGAGVWGNVNIYYFSYLKQFDPELRFRYFSIAIAVTGIPLTILMIFSVQIAEQIGHIKLIRSLMFIFPICIFLSSFCTNFYAFTSFYLLSTVLIIGSCTMPTLHCLWSHFKQVGKATGIVMTGFGVASIVINLALTLMINPDNKRADIHEKHENQDIYYFGPQVANNVPSSIRYLAIIYACCAIPGSLLLSFKEQQIDQIQEPVAGDSPGKIENKGNQEIQIELQTSSKDVPSEIVSTKIDNDIIDADELSKECPDLRTGLLSTPFIIIYAASFLVNLYLVFLNLNFQAFGLTQLNDDHLLMYMINVNAVVGSLSNLVWGHFVDKMSFKKIYRILLIAFSAIAITLPWMSENGITFFISYCLLGCVDQGAYTIMGPGLVQLFGLKVGTQILPVQSTSLLLVIMIMPILQILLFHFFDYDGVILLLGSLIIIAIILVSFLRHVYFWQKLPDDSKVDEIKSQ